MPKFNVPMRVNLPDAQNRLWCYLNLPKFISMLTTNSLWFGRGDQLGDPLEGSLAQFNVENRVETYKDSIPEEAFAQMAIAKQIQRSRVFCNCWFESEYESWGMWSNYSDPNGVVIVSDLNAMEAAFELPDKIMAGKVNYVDYKTFWIPEGNVLEPFFYKQIEYSSEKEFRLVINSFETTKYLPTVNPDMRQPSIPGKGISVPVDLTKLISEIRVHPYAPDWYLDQLSNTISKLGHSFKLENSGILTEPHF